MTEHRWSKFWWADYEGDDALRVVSLAAQGLWMRMLCAMHKGTPYGHLTINGKQPTTRQIALMASTTEREAAKLITELEEAGVFSRADDGTIFNRRMVKDKAVSEKAREDGKRGGNPALKPEPTGGVNPSDKGGAYTLEAEAEAEERTPLSGGSAPRSAAPPPRPANGCRLAPDWQPDEPGYEGATPATLARFRDHWLAQPGAKGRKADWQATWRNWCRRDAEQRSTQPKPKLHTLPPAEQDRRILAAVGLNFDDPPPLAAPMRIVQ